MDTARNENASLLQHRDNVVSIEEQKFVRANKNTLPEIESVTALDVTNCEDGLCLLTWKPERSAA